MNNPYRFIKIIIIFVLTGILSLSAQGWQSAMLSVGNDGELTYHPDKDGFILPDFSTVGYRRGGVDIPDVPVKKTISPVNGDNTAHIQSAIEEIGMLPLDKNGIRGALLLLAGQYDVYGTIFVPYDGVVIRGVGNDDNPKTSTIIFGRGNSPAKRTIIRMGARLSTDVNKWKTSVTNKTNITDAVVNASSKSFTVQSTAGYNVGNQILICHPANQQWINSVEGGLSGAKSCNPWGITTELDILYNRYITAIDHNTKTITIDAPVYSTLRQSLCQAYIHKFSASGIYKEVGIENLRVKIEYDPNVFLYDNVIGEYEADEKHAWEGVSFNSIENGWAKNVVVTHYTTHGFYLYYSTRITIDNCQSIDPVSVIEGTKRYGFCTMQGAQQILIKNCYGRNGRHHYISNGAARASGIVIYKMVSDRAFACSEGHRCWTTGILFDGFEERNYVYPKDDFTLGLFNRGCYGNGHGWGSAHSIMWNCNVRAGTVNKGHIVVQKPPTAQNYSIGCFAHRIDNKGPYPGELGYVEGTNRSGLNPSSLYEAQLRDRGLSTGINNITTEKQIINISYANNMLKIKSEYPQKMKISLFSTNGSSIMNVTSIGDYKELSLIHLAKGTYIVHVATDVCSQTEKIFVGI